IPGLVWAGVRRRASLVNALQNLKLSRKLAFAFGGIVVAVAACNAFIYASNKAVDVANADAATSRELINSGKAVLAAAVEAQNAMRGLAATEDSSFVDGYRSKIQELDAALAHLREVDTDPADADDLQGVADAITAFRAEADHAVQEGR